LHPCISALIFAQKLVGRKRHILVDTQGFLLSVVIYAANLPDRKDSQWVLVFSGVETVRLLNRRAVGRVGWQEEQRAAARRKGLPNAGSLVDAQRIAYDDLFRPERRP